MAASAAKGVKLLAQILSHPRSMHGCVISARMHDCRLPRRRTPQQQHPGGAMQWQPCTMVELRDHITTAQHQDHRLPLLRCTMITSSTQCTEVRALNLMRAAREGVEGLREKVCKWPTLRCI